MYEAIVDHICAFQPKYTDWEFLRPSRHCAGWQGQEQILPLEKWIHFFLGPCLLVCQFIEIYNQMELNDEWSLQKRNIYNGLLYMYILISKFKM